MDHIIRLKQAARMRMSAATAAGRSSFRQRARPSTTCICGLCLCFVHCILCKAYDMLHQDHWAPATHAHASAPTYHSPSCGKVARAFDHTTNASHAPVVHAYSSKACTAFARAPQNMSWGRDRMHLNATYPIP